MAALPDMDPRYRFRRTRRGGSQPSHRRPGSARPMQSAGPSGAPQGSIPSATGGSSGPSGNGRELAGTPRSTVNKLPSDYTRGVPLGNTSRDGGAGTPASPQSGGPVSADDLRGREMMAPSGQGGVYDDQNADANPYAPSLNAPGSGAAQTAAGVSAEPSSSDDSADTDGGGTSDNTGTSARKSSGGGTAVAGAAGGTAGAAEAQEGADAPATSQAAVTQDTEAEQQSAPSKGGGAIRGWYQKHKKAVVVSGAVSVLLGGGGGFMALPIIQGSVLIHESKIFSRFMAKNQHDSSSRTRQLFRFVRAWNKGNAGETRVGIAGSKVFGGVMDELAGKGVTFETNPNGSLAKVNIDPEKLKASFPEMDQMNSTEMQDFLRDKFGLSGDAGYNLFNTGTADAPKFTIDARYLDFKTTRLLANKAISLVEDGKIPTFIKWRIAAKYWNLPNAFHPWEKAKAMAGNKINDKLSISDEQKKQEAAREEAVTEPINEASADKVKAVEDGADGLKAKVTKTLTVTGFVCIAYNLADDIVAVNHARVVLASEARANDIQAGASQMEDGSDFASYQPAALVHNQVDADGKGIFTSAAWQAASTDGTQQGGYQISPEYKGAFSDNSTAANIRNAIDTLTLHTAPAVCSTAGTILQVAALVGLTFMGNPEVTLAPGAIAKWTGEQLASGLTMHFLNDFILNKATIAKLGAKMFQGPIGGELLTLGARAMANTAGVASGGISLGNTTSTMFAAQEAEADHQAFMHENAFARVFDINNYQSLSGHLADALVPMYDGGPRAFASSLFNLGHTMGSAISGLLPHASAAAPYNWGFSQYGIPESMLNDPRLADPYNNASQAVSIIQSSGTTYTDRAMKCFGVNITDQTPDQKWDVIPTQDVNTASQDYTDAHCNDISDFNWQRVIMFVEDTNNMNAVACFQGDNTACSTVQGTPAASQATAPAAGAGGPTTAITDPFSASDTMTCSAGTDGGVQDGYYNGQLVKIKICNVQGIQVNARLAANLNNLLNDAKAQGVTMSGGGFRTMQGQIDARKANHCPDIYTSPASSCHPPTAIPGYSNHQMGLAVDFTQNGSTIKAGSQGFQWLQANAAKYGLKNLPSETWHWSVDGN